MVASSFQPALPRHRVMDAIEASQRERVVAETKSWLGTKYHHMGRIKGVGVDCLTLLAEVFTAAGLIDRPEIPYYPQQWMHNRDAERYLEGLFKYTRPIDGDPLPGDIAVWRFGRCFSHGAVVIQWPKIIHAHVNTNCILDDAESAAWLMYIGDTAVGRGEIRPRRFFSYWGK